MANASDCLHSAAAGLRGGSLRCGGKGLRSHLAALGLSTNCRFRGAGANVNETSCSAITVT